MATLDNYNSYSREPNPRLLTDLKTYFKNIMMRFYITEKIKILCFLFLGILSTFDVKSQSFNSDNISGELKQWHTISLQFEGPKTSENAIENPFLNYRLSVEFMNDKSQYTIRGFYSADGNSAETSADSGNIWQVNFTPDQIGDWTYTAKLHYGDQIALDDHLENGVEIKLNNAKGTFHIKPSDKTGVDFRAHGRLKISKGYFHFQDSDFYWLKGGADSPENLLAYKDFDATYRMQSSSKDGEAKTSNQIHLYEPHWKDWQPGDPTWQDDKGKGIIGAINYLSSTGMNVVYFLTMNINGDGKDVWPYISPEVFNRFDVSKLAQWEIVFRHMQSKGIMLHIVLQETENETLLDNGDTGPMRQLYLRELIARFGHHLALQWNLGEENGPAHWTPIGQNDQQRKSMTSFIKRTDPYDHPVLLHTHSSDPIRSGILEPILGFKELDGLSLQVDHREGAATVVQTWKKKAHDSGHDWLITMDEIGEWHTGAVSDSLDPNHDTLRRYVLWGTLLSGAAGVEWYFGARNLHNDLTSEDWRRRDRLWELTSYALDFFQTYLPYWEMQPQHALINSESTYCFQKTNEIYAIYLPEPGQYTINLNEVEGRFSIHWYDPLKGGDLQTGSIKIISGDGIREIGNFPSKSEYSKNQDWVVLLKRIE